MSKAIKVILFIAICGIVAGGAYIIRVFTKAPEEVLNITPDYTLEASLLYEEYESDEEAANAKYLDKVIQVTGPVAEILLNNDGEINLIVKEEGDFSGVNCSFAKDEQDELASLEFGDKVTIKGFCTGMLMDVVLNRCVLVEKP